MFELIKYELRKIFRNKILWIMCLIFLAMIFRSMYSNNQMRGDNYSPDSSTTVEEMRALDQRSEFLTGSYNKDNYKDLYKQYEYYWNQINNHSYTSTKQCTFDEYTIGYGPISDVLDMNGENCERLQDAIKAFQSIQLYHDIKRMFTFDTVDESGFSPAEYFVQNAIEGTMFHDALSLQSATKLSRQLSEYYQKKTFYFEPNASAALAAFTGAMRDRTIHYITFMILLGLAGIFAKEQQNHVKELALTMKKGRSKLVYAKLTAGLMYTIAVFTMLTGFTFLCYALTYDLSIQKVSMQFLFLMHTLYPINLLQYSLLYTGILLAMVLATSLLVSLCSSLCKHNYSAFLLSIFTLYVPVILYSSFMYTDFTRFSLLNTVDTNQLFPAVSGIELGSFFLPAMPCVFIVYILVILSSFLIIRQREKKTPTY